MIYQNGKYAVSLSDELAFYISKHLISLGVKEQEAQYLSQNYTSIKEAIENSTLKTAHYYPKPCILKESERFACGSLSINKTLAP